MIYFLAKSLSGRDGGSRAGADLLQALVAPGREIRVVCTERCGVPAEIEAQPVPSPYWLGCPGAVRSAGRYALSPRSIAREMIDLPRRLRIARALRRNEPVLSIHNGFPIPGWVNTDILERSSSRLIVVHSSPEALDFFARDTSGWTREWVGDKLRRADALMFVTPQIRDAWSQVAGLRGVQTFVVPNTTKESDARRVLAFSRTEIRRSLGLPEDAFIASCVAKVDVSKGQDVLVEALPSMVKCAPGLHLVLVGAMTSYGAHLPDKIKAMGLDGHVSFAGSRDDAYSFIRASDLLIHPSRAEGQGLAVLEAMILGTPVLATDVGGIPFAIEHGISGWLVPPGNATAIATAFEILARDSQLRERLAAAAEERYWEGFSRAKHRQRVQAMLESCLARALAKTGGRAA